MKKINLKINNYIYIYILHDKNMIYKIINDPRLNIHGQLHPRTVGTIGKPYVCEQPYVNTGKSKLT
jgi:hypothetical protein